ncbi:MAG: UDP-N-acetylmuramate dehydrogenase [Desulfobacterales bacterium]|nr:UDP-N-acetylmuramate dehydrogenase [Desulfobacterales bacterium]
MAIRPDITTLFNGLAVEKDQPMATFTSFRVGGPADLLGRPETVEDLLSMVKTARKAQIPVTIFGGGTNTLVSDKGIRGLVIILSSFKQGVEQESPGKKPQDTKVTISALTGERLATLCKYALEKGFSGLEWAAGIPGTLGGAIIMNAGSFKGDMSQVIKKVEILNLQTLEIETLKKDELNFSYRKLELENIILLRAQLLLEQADPELVRSAHEVNLKAKRSTQPVSMASGGCFFKNPSQDKPAGWLIEQAGLKGFKLNGAMVSDLHANFIVNHENAQCKDILALKQVVQERVYEKFGIKLNAEVKTIGD